VVVGAAGSDLLADDALLGRFGHVEIIPPLGGPRRVGPREPRVRSGVRSARISGKSPRARNKHSRDASNVSRRPRAGLPLRSGRGTSSMRRVR
jgi:hypothetical protein